MPNSQPVSPGDPATAKQYNDLRADVLDTLTGHTHSGLADDGKAPAQPIDEALAYVGFPPDIGGN